MMRRARFARLACTSTAAQSFRLFDWRLIWALGSPHLGCPASTAGTCLPSPWPSPSPPTVAFAIAPSSLPAMSRYRDAQLPSPSATAMRSSPMPASPRLRSMPCHACSATAMRSPLPWPRCLSRYRDAQLPSPSPPMQSKTVALAPMPASMPSRSRLPLPACVFAPGHVTLPRCSVAFAISPDAVQDRFETSPAGSWLPASRLPLPACVFAPGHVTLPRCAVAFAISPDAVQDRFRLSCGKLFTFRTLLREVVHLRESTTRCTVADGGGLPGLRVLSRASWGYDLRQRIG